MAAGAKDDVDEEDMYGAPQKLGGGQSSIMGG